MKFTAIAAAALLAAPLAPLSAASDDLTLEQRVERMEAESAIRQTLMHYGAYLDGRDYAGYAGLFASDGVWVGGFGSFTGPAAIEAMLKDSLGEAEAGFINKSSFHMMTNPIIEVHGNRATANSRYLFWTRSGNKPAPALAGRYVDEFVRENGEWKIARRTTYGVIPYRDPNHPETNDPAPAMGGPTPEQRLQRAEDILAIQRLIVDYASTQDAHDFDAYAALFAPDGQWVNGSTVYTGPEEIKGMLNSIYGPTPDGYVNTESYHLVSNPEIEVDGDTATAKSRHLLIMRGEGGHPTPMLTGQYVDELVRIDGEWKFQKRTDNPVMPTRAEWLKFMQARNAAD